MNEEQIEQIVKKVLRDLRLGSGVTAAAPATMRTEPATLAFKSEVQENHGIPSKARAAVLVEKKRLELKEFPLRNIREDEILVCAEGCGVCGTDIHGFNNDPFNLCQVVLGHEDTVEVIEVGRAVCMDSVGKLVRSDSSFFVVNDKSLELRVLIGPAAVAAHALERAKKTGLINFRSRVIVQGCGLIDLMMIAIDRTTGVNNLIAIDGNAGRLSTAQQVGADHTINFRNHPTRAGLIETVNAATKGLGVHFAFQVTWVTAAASTIWKVVWRVGGIGEVGCFVDGGECSINPHEDISAKKRSCSSSAGPTSRGNIPTPIISCNASHASASRWKNSSSTASRSTGSPRRFKRTSVRKASKSWWRCQSLVPNAPEFQPTNNQLNLPKLPPSLPGLNVAPLSPSTPVFILHPQAVAMRLIW